MISSRHFMAAAIMATSFFSFPVHAQEEKTDAGLGQYQFTEDGLADIRKQQDFQRRQALLREEAAMLEEKLAVEKARAELKALENTGLTAIAGEDGLMSAGAPSSEPNQSSWVVSEVKGAGNDRRAIIVTSKGDAFTVSTGQTLPGGHKVVSIDTTGVRMTGPNAEERHLLFGRREAVREGMPNGMAGQIMPPRF